MSPAPPWTKEEFKIVVCNPYLKDDELALRLGTRSKGAVGVVRVGIHAFHTGGNISMLSRMMRCYLKEKGDSVICPVCHKALNKVKREE